MNAVFVNNAPARIIRLDDIPIELLSVILKNLSYDEIAQKRLVSRKFNALCGSILTTGLKRADDLKNKEWKRIKSNVPRRESERRAHPLSRHLEILSALDTRTALLNMTYQRYIEGKHCPFIPGKVLDEIFSVLHKVATQDNLPRSHEVLKELRDISSMAIEHFDEVVAPGFKTRKSIYSLEACDEVASTVDSPYGSISRRIICPGVVTSPNLGNISLVQMTPSGSSSHSTFSFSGTPRSQKQLEASLTKENQELKDQVNRMTEEIKSLQTRVSDLERASGNGHRSTSSANSSVDLYQTLKEIKANLKFVENQVQKASSAKRERETEDEVDFEQFPGSSGGKGRKRAIKAKEQAANKRHKRK